MTQLLLTIGAAIILLNVVSVSATAQDKGRRNNTIIIQDGDTLFNGKKLNELSKLEQTGVRRALQGTESRIGQFKKGRSPQDKIIIRGLGAKETFLNMDTLRTRPFKWRFEREDSGGEDGWSFNNDDFVKLFKDTSTNRMMIITPNDYSIEIPNAVPYPNPIVRERRFPARGPLNSQTFNYSNIDKNGFVTNYRLTVSEAPESEAEKKFNDSKMDLEVNDLIVFPKFSSGTMTISCVVPTKGTTRFQLIDSDEKVVLSKKLNNFSGTFNSEVPMLRNGIYYISIVQNGKGFVRKIVKESR